MPCKRWPTRWRFAATGLEAIADSGSPERGHAALSRPGDRAILAVRSVRPAEILGRAILPQVMLGVRHGVSLDEAAALGLDAGSVGARDVMVGADAVYAHLELVASRAPFERYVVELATSTTVGALGPVGLGLRAHADARHALAWFSRYQSLVNTLTVVDTLEIDGVGTYLEHRLGPPRPGSLLATEVALMTAIHLWRDLGPRDFRPRRVRIRRKDADAAIYETFAGAPVVTGADQGSFEFDAAALDHPLRGGDDELLKFLDEILEERRSVAARSPALILSVRRALMALLADGPPTLEAVARRLSMSGRTLQRRLAEDGVAFADVVDSVRSALARAYLEKADLSGSEIALMLGYTEQSSFSRAFRRWFGTSPAQFRARGARVEER